MPKASRSFCQLDLASLLGETASQNWGQVLREHALDCPGCALRIGAIDRLNAALTAAGKDKESQIHVYPDMPHAFHADYRPSYRKEAAEDGWKRMLAWFARHGVA